MTEPSILITGGDGWMGNRLQERLQGEGIEFTAVGRKDADLAEASSVRVLFSEIRPTTIIHLAASLARGNSIEAREQQWRDTVQVGWNVLSAAGIAGTSHVVAVGSMEELGDQAGALDPTLPPRPRTAYGLAKSLVLQIAQYCAAADRLSVDWFRPTTVYGPGQTGSMLIPTAFEAAVERRSAAFTDGRQQRDFVYIDDVVNWLLSAVSRSRTLIPGRVLIHHVGSGEGVSVRQVLRTIASHFPDSDFRLGTLPRRPDEPEIQYARPHETTDPTMPDWQPYTGLEEGIQRTAQWWKSKHWD